MNLITNGTNFCGRYVLIGKSEQINKAATEIKAVKKDDVEFYPITCKDKKMAIVATNEDAFVLRDKKQENLNSAIREFCKDKKTFLSNVIKYIFGTDSDTLIVENDGLARFLMPSKSTNFDNGTTNSKYKSAETFVDGTIKSYSLRGNLCQIKKADGTIEYIGLDGTRTLIDPKNENKSAPKKTETKKEKESAPKEAKAPKSKKTKKAQPNITSVVIPNISLIPVPTTSGVCSPIETSQNVKPVKIIEVSTLPPLMPEYLQNEDEFDSKRRLIGRTFFDGTKANYHYVNDSREILFTSYSDGRIESSKGIADINTQTIRFPYKDGIWKVVDTKGQLKSFVFPDGTIKNYDRNENLTEKIYPNGKKELFTKEGKLYLIINPDGSYEDIKITYPRQKLY